MKKQLVFGLFGIILLISATDVQGQTVTVNMVRNFSQDSWVVLRGNIVNAWTSNYYTFRDSTGEILVEIPSNVWRGLSVNETDFVEICGEVRISSSQTTIRVRAISGNGETIVVPGQGVMVNQPITINEARNLPQNSWVILRGNIINNVLGGNIFTFRDSSGDIFVEIPRSVWRGITVDESNRVEISGEVMISRGQISIRVRVIRKI